MNNQKSDLQQTLSSTSVKTTGYGDMDTLEQTPISKRERLFQRGLIFLGVLILGYVYSNSLTAQQAASQRISVSQAVNFPNDI